VLRAYWMSNTAPCGPTYINLDAEVQEGKLPAPLPPIDAKRYMPPVVQGPSADLVKKAVDLLAAAKKPLILMGRCRETSTTGSAASNWPRRSTPASPPTSRSARVPDRPSAAYRLPGDLRHRRPDQCGEGGRCHPEP
jgi:hypothetical protein